MFPPTVCSPLGSRGSLTKLQLRIPRCVQIQEKESEIVSILVESINICYYTNKFYEIFRNYIFWSRMKIDFFILNYQFTDNILIIIKGILPQISFDSATLISLLNLCFQDTTESVQLSRRCYQ